ncbi:MAG: hypothetical protein E6I57_08535 [Chloroflexi bacterium]|nr:MAG: hypothetical protein E6J27_09675 [Chloroflexota bacterium]TME38831.1 MAG: hypothetical protein E6I57_08535 [Chloroflexota bacterium]
MFRALKVVMTALIVLASLGIYSGRAYAHERRMVGAYQFVVGWLTEPAYLGQLNSLDLRITDTRQNPAAPVSGLEKTLTADVAAGGLTPFPLAVTARFGTAGAYNGVVMPTVKGTYTFHITGKIDTTNIDEKFTSGPNTFGDIEDTAAVQYPQKVPVADELGKRLDAIQSGVDQTRILAIVAVALAVVGLGGAALARRRTR